MKLIKTPKNAIANHPDVTADRAGQIVDHLSHIPEDDLPGVVQTFRANRMPAAELALVEELLGLSEPSPKSAAKKARK